MVLNITFSDAEMNVINAVATRYNSTAEQVVKEQAFSAINKLNNRDVVIALEREIASITPESKMTVLASIQELKSKGAVQLLDKEII